LTRHYARSWGYRILATCQMRKSEEPLVVHHFLTWWLIDVCGSSVIFARSSSPEDHHRALAAAIQQVPPDWNGSDQWEDLATLGAVQLRETLALWTLASRLPGERPLLQMNGDCEHSNAPAEYALKEGKINLSDVLQGSWLYLWSQAD